MKRTRSKIDGITTPLREWIPALFLAFLLMILSGCASPRGNGAAKTEELLGQEVTEGRVIEGTIDPSREGGGEEGAWPSGYRIQLMASTIREEAEGIADMVKGCFPVKVYVDYSEAYYRVRVGDFGTRGEAEEFQKELADYGFDPTWIVETEIQTE